MYNSLIIVSLAYLATPAVNALRIVQPYRVVATDRQAKIECRFASLPHTHTQRLELHVTLLKGLHGNATVCSDYIDSSARSKRTQGLNVCEITLSDSGVSVSASRLKGDDTDMYRCVVKVLYPPPYLERFGNGTLVYVPEKPECSLPEMQYQTPKLDQGNDRTNMTQKERQGLRVTWVELPLPLVVAIGILIECAIIIYQVNRIRHTR
ncbi:cytotoxic T-lymphocyte protein 4-like [Alosa pseudoharengus]|uniref:cytotoxic T-lymphocyte protein 4-like n=1 Tax=Alosa pseudoharengus TaxID=34774 RepID=UPI003F8B243A